MKRILSFITILAVLFSLGTVVGTTAIASGEFEKSAWNFVTDINVGWNLGNTLDVAPCWGGETGWGNPVTTQAMIDSVKAKGFNAIRIPVTWYGRKNETSAPDYKIDASWMARAKEVVDYAVKNDMYIVLNMHHDGDWLVPVKFKKDGMTWDEDAFLGVLEMYSAAWTQIANEFKGYNEKLIFESNNEVRDQENWSGYEEAYKGIARINQTFVDTIRATGGNNAKRYLTVKAYASGADRSLARDFVMPNDPANHLIFDCHNYTASFVSTDGTTNNSTKVFDKEAFTKSMTKSLDILKTYFLDNGIPCFISEWGTTSDYNLEQRALHAEEFVKLCGQYGVKCFWWDNGSNYSVFERQSLKWHGAIADKMVEQGNAYIGVTLASSTTLFTAAPETTTTTTIAPKIVYGDANNDGNINALDLLAIKKYIVGTDKNINVINSDCNFDKKVNAVDMLLIKKHIVQIKIAPWD